MAYSQAQLQALQNALARGITRVTYEGRTMEYGSVDALRKAILIVQADLNRQSGAVENRQVRIYATKGFSLPSTLPFPFTVALQAQRTMLSGYVALNIGTILNGVSVPQATPIFVQGAPIGAPVLIEANPALPTGVTATGSILAPDTVTMAIANLSGGPVTLGSGIYTAVVLP